MVPGFFVCSPQLEGKAWVSALPPGEAVLGMPADSAPGSDFSVVLQVSELPWPVSS